MPTGIGNLFSSVVHIGAQAYFIVLSNHEKIINGVLLYFEVYKLVLDWLKHQMGASGIRMGSLLGLGQV